MTETLGRDVVQPVVIRDVAKVLEQEGRWAFSHAIRALLAAYEAQGKELERLQKLFASEVGDYYRASRTLLEIEAGLIREGKCLCEFGWRHCAIHQDDGRETTEQGR